MLKIADISISSFISWRSSAVFCETPYLTHCAFLVCFTFD